MADEADGLDDRSWSDTDGEVERRVLGVDQNPVEPGVGDDLGGRRRYRIGSTGRSVSLPLSAAA